MLWKIVMVIACFLLAHFRSARPRSRYKRVGSGPEARHFADRANNRRVDRAELEATEASKEHRTALRNARILQNDAYEDQEGVVYEAGMDIHELKNERTKLIIDTDAGSDDAVGIFLALAVKEIDVVAITCTFGNTQEANVETNVLKIMTIAKRSDVPIYAGATRPLLQNYTQSYYFGKDGLGDFVTNIKPIGTIDRTKHASIAMIELARKYPGEISVVVLGPPTNVALAASLDSNFTRNIKRFHVMGARINLPEYIVNRMVQFNFGLDVESVAIFLNSKTQLKTRVITSDLAHSNTIDKKWRQEVLGKLNSTRIQFMNKVEALVLNRSLDWAVADSITVAATIWPELVTSSYEAHMSAITCHPYKGLVSVSVNGLDSKDKNVEIGKTFDSAAFKDKLLKYLA